MCAVESPYRELAAVPLCQAASREGKVRLEVGPQHVRIELGERQHLMVSGRAATWVRHRRGADHRRELGLDGARLWAARSFPTRDLALWYECRPGHVERLGGVRPVAPFEPGALAAWQALDRLAGELGEALAPHAGEATGAVELGRGAHRVLLLELGERLVVYARPLFRERLRRALEVSLDGSLVVPGRHRDRSTRFASRAHVRVCGDRIRFTGGDGRDLVSLWLPWIALEDRQELVRRFGELVDPAPPEPDYEPRTDLRPWASGLGRMPPMSALAPAPLPHSVMARFRR
jgi:hypothetical protein